jgi:hypothetical protein
MQHILKACNLCTCCEIVQGENTNYIIHKMLLQGSFF